VHPVTTDLAGDGHDRHPVQIGVGQARGQVGRAGAECGQAQPGAPGEAPVDVGHEGRALLVAGRDEADGRVDEGVVEVEGLLAGAPEDVLHPFALEAADQQLGTGHCCTPHLRCKKRVRPPARSIAPCRGERAWVIRYSLPFVTFRTMIGRPSSRAARISGSSSRSPCSMVSPSAGSMNRSGGIPKFTKLDSWIRAYDLARTTSMPRYMGAMAACSPLDPCP